MSISPSKKAPHLIDPANLPLPASPSTQRTVRRLASHQQLSSTNIPSLISQQRNQQQQRGLTRKQSRDELQQSTQNRLRAKSDAPVPEKRPTSSRKTPMASAHARKSSLEFLLREGPPNGDLYAGLSELRYKILSSRVEATNTGMVSPSSYLLFYLIADNRKSEYRIYLWLILLNIHPLSTDEYLTLVHRGRSSADPKIRNDTFRTLATDPLFQRRVTEASLTRVLNAVAWKLHDARQAEILHRPASPTKNPLPPDRPSTSSSSGRPSSSSSNLLTNPTDQGSALYVQGMNVLSAPFLYAARSETEAFTLFNHFISHECPGYIRGAMEGVHKGLTLVDKCLSLVEPKLYNYLVVVKGMPAEIWGFPSVMTFCACTPPLPEVLHLWDFLFAYGPHLNILCIVAQLLMLKDQLMSSSR